MKRIILFRMACILAICILCFSCKKEDVVHHPVAPLLTGGSDRALPYTYTDWMAGLADNMNLSDITIPGTHDCAADNHSGGIPDGSHWDVASQDFRFSNQLLLGVRWFDVRYDDVDKKLHHGGFALSRSLEDIIDEALSFLSAHPKETVIFMIKKEYGGSTDGTFSNKVWEILNKYDLDHFYLDDANPSLINVRGKIVLATHDNSNRNGHPLGLSFHWPGNTPWHESGTSFNCSYVVQDHYSINYVSYSTKCNNIKKLLNFFANGLYGIFQLNFTSAERDARATSIKTVADNINGNIYKYLWERSDWRNRGVIMLNYAGGADGGDCCEPLVRMIIQLNDFETVQIGSQVWMGRDWNGMKYHNGDHIPKVQNATEWSKLTTGAYYEDSNQNRYYNWYAVNDPRGLAPAGWRVPTVTDWDILISSAGGEDMAGRNLEEAGNSHWMLPTRAQNTTLFTALPMGLRNAEGTVEGVGWMGNWWCATEWDQDNAVFYLMNSLPPADPDWVQLFFNPKKTGFSVRLIKE